jgi:phosphoglycolate phosphatase-like HAD superfamily hydrolase
MKSISVTWGCFSEGRLRKSLTHHVIHEMPDLLPLVGL